ncbi:MAG: hypothetical protein P1T08_18855 [Acidimicrobiia bacterium]|nr:hypothetical protein [Acidimicrobiia bacterium]
MTESTTTVEFSAGTDSFPDRTEDPLEQRLALAPTVASPSDSDSGQQQQTVTGAATERTSDTPLVSPSKRIVIRSAPTTTTTTPTTTPVDRTDFWRSIVDSIGSTAPTTTTTTTPTDDPPTTTGVSIVKTESGGAPESVFHFEVRVGATPDSPGAAIAAGSTDETGAVELTCVEGVAGGACLELTTTGASQARFPPGTYQLCETGIPPGWDNDLDGFTPGEDDGSTECIDIDHAH